MGIRKHTKWGSYIVLKRMSELEEHNKKLQHSHKEPNKDMGR
jgi:hypothetical protein